MRMATFCGLGSWTEGKGGTELSTFIHLSVLSDCEYNITSSLKLPPRASPTLMACITLNCDPPKALSFLKLLLPGILSQQQCEK